MFKWMMVLTLAILLVMSAGVMAQNKMKPAIYAGGGLGMPLSPTEFKDGYKMGYGFGAGVGLEFTPGIEVIGKFFYNTFSLDVPDGADVDGGDFKSLEFGVDGKYLFMANQPEMKIHPYILVGVGMANVKVTEATIGDETFPEESETKLMFNGGGGVEFAVSPKAAIWVDARYATVLTEDESISYLPIRAGVKFFVGN